MHDEISGGERALESHDEQPIHFHNAIGNISANISTLHEWFNSYSRSHRIRLAFDLDYVDRFALPENLILEVGAIPFILTLGLMQKITGLLLWIFPQTGCKT